jgi:hypothetical protein
MSSYLLIGGSRCQGGAGAELPPGQADGQLLTWNAAAGEWLPQSPTPELPQGSADEDHLVWSAGVDDWIARGRCVYTRSSLLSAMTTAYDTGHEVLPYVPYIAMCFNRNNSSDREAVAFIYRGSASFPVVVTHIISKNVSLSVSASYHLVMSRFGGGGFFYDLRLMRF